MTTRPRSTETAASADPRQAPTSAPTGEQTEPLVEGETKQNSAVGRVLGLDGMRTLAALAVLSYHLLPGSTTGGFLGVDVFFVLSGFLITSLLVREVVRKGRLDLRRFWLRRVRRLFPAVALMVGCTLPLAPLVSIDIAVGIRSQVLGALAFCYNWVEIFTGGAYFDRGNPHLFLNVWSLAVEQQFYLVWPAILVLVFLLPGRFRWVVPAVLGIVSAALMAWFASGDNIDRAYLGTDSHAFGLMTGATLALLVPWALTGPIRQPSPRELWGRGFAAWAGLASLAILVFLIDDMATITYPGGILLAVAATVLVIQGLLADVTAANGPAKLLSAFLELRPLVWLGERSYGIYLWHWPLIVLTNAAFPTAPTLVTAPILAALSVGIAELSYRHVETPMRRDGIGFTLRAWAQRAMRRAEVPDFRFGRAMVPFIVMAFLVTSSAYALISAPSQTSAEAYVAAGATQKPEVKTKPPAPTQETKAAPVTGTQVMIIGDSVTLAARPALLTALPGATVDGKVSRSIAKAVPMLEAAAKNGTLRPYVVLGLNTNSAVTEKHIEKIIGIIGKDRKLVFITGYGPARDVWIEPSNTVVRQAQQRFPNQIRIAEWGTAIAPHQDFLARDNTHPDGEGAKIYAATVVQALQSFAKPTK